MMQISHSNSIKLDFSDYEHDLPSVDETQSLEREFLFLSNDNQAEVLSQAALKLAVNGWCVIGNVKEEHLPGTLAMYGSIVPQFSGELTYDVKAEAEFENYQYSKSANTIHPHTEAPVYATPPKFLALYAKCQAKCGGGHTLLADGYEIYQNLPEEIKTKVATKILNFGGFDAPSKSKALTNTSAPSLHITCGSDPIIRFSYNVFRHNNLHPRKDEPLRSDYFDDSFYDVMIRHVLTQFYQKRLSILIPDNAVLIFNNHRMIHGRIVYRDLERHLIRYWLR